MGSGGEVRAHHHLSLGSLPKFRIWGHGTGREGSVWWGSEEGAVPRRPSRKWEGLAAVQASWLQETQEAHALFSQPSSPTSGGSAFVRQGSLQSPLPVVRLRPVRVLEKEESEARG